MMTNALIRAHDRRGLYLPPAQGLHLGRGEADAAEPAARPPLGIYHVSTPPQGGQR